MHIPEKWFPGSVDIYLNSHNIMHVLVVVAVYSMHQATIRDIEWMQRAECGGLNYTSTVNIDSINASHLEL
ncbi:AGAP000844-PA-like protein [Anopheles sinensis]|uniref:AGAP000844-PA-like protein n=2 Tax=Myzorhynchus TaxID=58250 RepID=A0A084WFC5_ANOSI|nr:AGAP000844-PA-like protein [Anopheles sinensis]